MSHVFAGAAPLGPTSVSVGTTKTLPSRPTVSSRRESGRTLRPVTGPLCSCSHGSSSAFSTSPVPVICRCMEECQGSSDLTLASGPLLDPTCAMIHTADASSTFQTGDAISGQCRQHLDVGQAGARADGDLQAQAADGALRGACVDDNLASPKVHYLQQYASQLAGLT